MPVQDTPIVPSPIVRCAYCRKERPVEEMMRGTITTIRRGEIVRETNWYCKGSGCHGYDQMAHEG